MIRIHARVVLVAVLIAGCGSNPVKKPTDAAPEPDLGTSLGGVGGPSSLTGGSGGLGGTSGTGGSGGLAEPPADGGLVDAIADVTPDSMPDVVDAQLDSQPDTVEAGPVCGAPLCTLGDKRCGTGGGLQTCAMVNGCPAWSAEVACGTNRSCSGAGVTTACTCNAAPTGCTTKGNFCMSNGTRATCDQDANGCFFISNMKTCGARQTCTGLLPGADCTCGNGATGCSVEGTYCSNSTTISTCSKDTDGCLFKSGTDTSCGNGKVCAASGNAAMCACPAAGTTVGSGCTSVGVAACAGDSVVTCTLDTVSSCKTWTLTNDCGAGGMICGSKSGAAACQCKEVTDGKYYVDPVAGSDATTTGAHPTGVQNPAACRLKTLSKASHLVASGGQIVATTQTLPGTFTSETFPLQIPTNVALTTSDATPTPIDYVIQFSGTSGNAIELANGASISGFTFNNISTGLSNSGVALSCTTGTVNASHLLVNGSSATNTMATGIAVGTAATSSCSGTFDTITVDGFSAGIHVDSTGTATVNTSIIRNSQPTDVGVLVSAGALKANDLTVRERAGGNHAGYAVRVVPSSQTVQASFDISNLQAVGPANDAVSLESGGANMAAPKGSLTGGAITAPSGATSSGIFIEAGTLTITGTSITTPGEYGLQVEGGTVNATGLGISGAGKDGVHVQGATSSLTLHQSQVTLSQLNNVSLTAGSVVVDDGSSLTSAVTGDGVNDSGGANTDLTVGGSGGGKVSVSGNAGHGIQIDGAGGAGSTIHVERTNLHANKKDGLHVAFTNGATRLTALNCEIDANTLNGVVVTSAPSNSGTANAVVLDTLDVHGHTGNSGADVGHGIWLHGNIAGGGDIAATINNSKVHENHNVGVVIDEDSAAPTTTITRETITGNDVSGNNSDAVDTATGGILFATPSTLTAFSANKVHSNRRDQIAFLAPQNGGLDWDLRPGTSCTAAINAVYCYSPDANSVGIRVSSATATTVEARNISWSHKPPTTGGKDFAVSGLGVITLGTDANANACAAIATCP